MESEVVNPVVDKPELKAAAAAPVVPVVPDKPRMPTYDEICKKVARTFESSEEAEKLKAKKAKLLKEVEDLDKALATADKNQALIASIKGKLAPDELELLETLISYANASTKKSSRPKKTSWAEMIAKEPIAKDWATQVENEEAAAGVAPASPTDEAFYGIYYHFERTFYFYYIPISTEPLRKITEVTFKDSKLYVNGNAVAKIVASGKVYSIMGAVCKKHYQDFINLLNVKYTVYAKYKDNGYKMLYLTPADANAGIGKLAFTMDLDDNLVRTPIEIYNAEKAENSEPAMVFDSDESSV